MTATNTKELNLLEKAAAEFAGKVLAPGREENDRFPFGPFFKSVLDQAFDLDFFHVTLPEDLGGIGHGVGALCIVLDNICREDASLGGIIFTTTFVQQVLLAVGEKERLAAIISDEKKADSFLMAYPVLCNPAEMKLTANAQEKDGAYVISGTVSYLVLGGIAKFGVIPAIVSGTNGYTFFLIDMADSAITKSEPVMSHGLHACPAVDITLSGVKGTPVGKVGDGNAYFKAVAETLQIAAAAMSGGVMKGSLKEAIAYCKERQQGGRKIKDWSAMQMLLADMAIQVQVADMLISRACQAVENKEKGWENCVHAASLHIQSAATQLTTDGIQALGGVGYMKDFGQEKRFRDAGQIQAFLGLAPMKKIRFIKRII